MTRTQGFQQVQPYCLISGRFVDTYFFQSLNGLTEEKRVCHHTKVMYENSLQWWELLTGNPALAEITDAIWNDFTRNMSGGTFRRGEKGPEKPLSEATQLKNARNMKALLGRAIKKRLCLSIEMTLPKVQVVTKPPFTIDDARQICDWLRKNQEPAETTPPRGWYLRQPKNQLGMPTKAWLTFVALGFYTGLRSGEMFALTWGMLVDRQGSQFLDVPSDAIHKTGKATSKPVHPCLAEALGHLGRGPDNEPILPTPGCERYVQTCHERIQRRAGIPEERIQSPHAWRRTHACHVLETGFPEALAIAQAALDHSDARVTLKHYVGEMTPAAAVRMLPRLW